MRLALYHKERGRIFAPTRAERESGNYTCPHCEKRPILKKRLFKIEEGQRHHILSCPGCGWSIQRCDIFTPQQGEHPELQPPPIPVGTPGPPQAAEVVVVTAAQAAWSGRFERWDFPDWKSEVEAILPEGFEIDPDDLQYLKENFDDGTRPRPAAESLLRVKFGYHGNKLEEALRNLRTGGKQQSSLTTVSMKQLAQKEEKQAQSNPNVVQPGAVFHTTTERDGKTVQVEIKVTEVKVALNNTTFVTYILYDWSFDTGESGSEQNSLENFIRLLKDE